MTLVEVDRAPCEDIYLCSERSGDVEMGVFWPRSFGMPVINEKLTLIAIE